MKKHNFSFLKRLLPLVVVLLLALSGCSKKEAPTARSASGADDLSERFVYSFAVVNSGQFTEGAQDFNNDAMAKHFEDKFNFEFGDVTVMSWSDWAERPRIWIASGDMPDFLQTNFSYSDYAGYYEQDLLKKFPPDWQSKYPSLYELHRTNDIGEYLEKSVGSPPAAFNNILYKYHKPTSPVLAKHHAFVVRKDWAKALGITEFKTAYKLSEMLAMVEKFQKDGKNIPGVRLGQTDTFTMTADQVIEIFLSNQWTYADKFYRDSSDGKYKWGPDNPKVFELVKVMKDAIDRGIVSPNFASFKNDEETLRFYTGGAFMCRTTAWVQTIFLGYNRFQESVGLDPFENIAEFIELDEEGNYVEEGNFNNWSVLYFSPGMSDKKFDRLLQIIDYVGSEEGQNLLRLGFEGKDYTKNGDEYVLNRPLDNNGNPLEIFAIYPFTRLWYHPPITLDDFISVDPSKPKKYQDISSTMWNDKQKYGNDTGALHAPDPYLAYFNGPNYLKRNGTLVRDGILGLITERGDLKTNYDNWIKSVRPVIDPILKELNDSLASGPVL
jgi:putative aldouronate transport system substrate-binding protein